MIRCSTRAPSTQELEVSLGPRSLKHSGKSPKGLPQCEHLWAPASHFLNSWAQAPGFQFLTCCPTQHSENFFLKYSRFSESFGRLWKKSHPFNSGQLSQVISALAAPVLTRSLSSSGRLDLEFVAATILCPLLPFSGWKHTGKLPFSNFYGAGISVTNSFSFFLWMS